MLPPPATRKGDAVEATSSAPQRSVRAHADIINRVASRSPESDCATGYCQVARRRPCSLHVSAGADWCVGVGVFETVLRGPSTAAKASKSALPGEVCIGWRTACRSEAGCDPGGKTAGSAGVGSHQIYNSIAFAPRIQRHKRVVQCNSVDVVLNGGSRTGTEVLYVFNYEIRDSRVVVADFDSIHGGLALYDAVHL